MRALALLLPALVLAAVLAGCGSSSSGGSGSAGGAGNSASGNTITLGISVPLSGAVASSCGPMNQGELAYFNHVNSTGGVQGKKIKVIDKDDGYAAPQAVTNAREFISDKVLAVTGECGSIQLPAMMPLLQQAGIPFLFPNGTCDPCEADSDYYDLLPDYGTQLADEIPYIFKKYGKGSVALFVTQTPGSGTVASSIESAVKTAGGTIAASYAAPAGTTDMTPYVLKMKAAHPDYVILNMIPEDAAVLTKAMASQGYAPPKYILGDAAIAQASFLTNMPASLDPKVIVDSDILSTPGSECASVLSAAKISVSPITLRGCGAAQVLVTALQEIKGPMTSAKLVSVLQSWKNKNASTVYPPLTFSSTQHVGVNAANLFVYGVKNSQLVKIGQL